MKLWILCFMCMVFPLILMHVLVKHDSKKGRYLPKSLSNSMELPAIVIILLCLATCVLAGMAFFREEAQDMSYCIALLICGLILMIYPVSFLRETKLDKDDFDMMVHLKVRKEVVFPWEFRPTAVFLATIFYLWGLLVLSLSVLMLVTIKFEDNKKIIFGIPLAVLLIGIYLSYLFFRQPRTQ